MKLFDFPYTIRTAKGVIHKNIVSDFPGISEGVVQIGAEKWIMPTKFAKFAKIIHNFEARSDDVWICSLPRSGATWMQEMIWLICNGLDYETALKVPLHVRYPLMELHTLMPNEVIKKTETLMDEKAFKELMESYSAPYYKLSQMRERRFIKTHLPLKLLPKSVMEVGAKVVYVARNPKDMAASWFKFSKTNPTKYAGDFEKFARYFMDDLTVWSPYWKHVLNGWENRHFENVHFMFYEDSQSDLAGSLRKLADFLGHPLKEEDSPKLMQHLSIDNMKTQQPNPAKKTSAINFKFMTSDKEASVVRRGQVVGNPKMTAEMSKKFDEWTEKNLAGSDLVFPVKKMIEIKNNKGDFR